MESTTLVIIYTSRTAIMLSSHCFQAFTYEFMIVLRLNVEHGTHRNKQMQSAGGVCACPQDKTV